MADWDSSSTSTLAPIDYARDHVDPLAPFKRENVHVLQDLCQAWAHQHRAFWSWDIVWLICLIGLAKPDLGLVAFSIVAIIGALAWWARFHFRGTPLGAHIHLWLPPTCLFAAGALALVNPPPFFDTGFVLLVLVFSAVIAISVLRTVRKRIASAVRLETTHLQPELAERFAQLTKALRANRQPGLVFFYHGFFGSIMRIAPVGDLLVMTPGTPDELQFATPDEVRLESPFQSGPGQMVHVWLVWKGTRKRVRAAAKDVDALAGMITKMGDAKAR